MVDTPQPEDTWQPTLDLAEIARVNRGDRVAVEHIADSTQDLFEKTLALVPREDRAGAHPVAVKRVDPDGGFIPENEDLRVLYLLAEAVGGYEAFHDLVNAYSPGNVLSQRYKEKAQTSALAADELRELEAYRVRIHQALKNANAYLRDVAVASLSRDEMHQLHDVILAASERAKEITRILGAHFMHDIERVVSRLYEFRDMIRNVEKSVSGIFLVDSEVMFIPTNELMACVNTLFKGVGNPYLARNVDGVLLLAARNLLIEVASFYSYYGKHQIYNLIERGGGGASTQLITTRIRYEIRKLFEACQKDNKLVLTRIMKNAERQFELSVVAITREAEDTAVEAVKLLIPAEQPASAAKKKRGLLRRLLGWVTGS